MRGEEQVSAAPREVQKMLESLILTGQPKFSCRGGSISGERWEGGSRGEFWAAPPAPVSVASALMSAKLGIAPQPLFPPSSQSLSRS